MRSLLNDANGKEIFPGDHIVAQIKTWNGYIEMCQGPVQYIETSHSCYGCGYAIVDPTRGNTFLNTLSKRVELLKI